MTTLLAFALILLLIIQCTSGAQVEACNRGFCGEMEIKFPFGLKGDNQGPRCSFPKFDVSCDNQSHTIYTLPKSGDLVINSIDYASQTILVNDPNRCLPRRFLQNLSLSGSPFQFDPNFYNLIDLTFLRCPSNVTQNYPLPPVYCLDDPTNSSFTVIYMWTRDIPSPLNESCDAIDSSVPYPISNVNPWPFWVDIGDDIQLTWAEPGCGGCEARGEDCGFAKDTDLQIGCFSRPQESSGTLPPPSRSTTLTIPLDHRFERLRLLN